MLEMPFAGEEHRNAELVTLPDGILVPDAAARLNYCLDAVFRGERHAVIEREERIGCEHETFGKYVLAFLLEGGSRLLEGYLRRTYAVHLACTHAIGHSVLSDHDGIGLDVLDYLPGEVQVLELLLSRTYPGNALLSFSRLDPEVLVLDEQTAVHAYELPAFRRYPAPVHINLQHT